MHNKRKKMKNDYQLLLEKLGLQHYEEQILALLSHSKIDKIGENSDHFTVKQFIAKHPAFTVGGIRALIFNEKTNGLKNSGAIVRIGKKVMIIESKFFPWIESVQLKK